MRKLIAAVMVAGFALSALADTLRITWAPNPMAEAITGYTVYEQAGTNWTAIGATTNTSIVLTVSPGQHVYGVVASNFWGESPFGPSVTTPAKATAPANILLAR